MEMVSFGLEDQRLPGGRQGGVVLDQKNWFGTLRKIRRAIRQSSLTKRP